MSASSSGRVRQDFPSVCHNVHTMLRACDMTALEWEDNASTVPPHVHNGDSKTVSVMMHTGFMRDAGGAEGKIAADTVPSTRRRLDSELAAEPSSSTHLCIEEDHEHKYFRGPRYTRPKNIRLPQSYSCCTGPRPRWHAMHEVPCTWHRATCPHRPQRHLRPKGLRSHMTPLRRPCLMHLRADGGGAVGGLESDMGAAP